MLALYPELIDQNRYTHEPHQMAAFTPQHALARPVVDRYRSFLAMEGYTDDARQASAEAGRYFFDIIIDSTTDFLRTFSTTE